MTMDVHVTAQYIDISRLHSSPMCHIEEQKRDWVKSLDPIRPSR